MLRRALSQSMHQLKLATSDAGAMVDRRIVTKLLLTWVERGRNDQSVLNLMASMLGFTGASLTTLVMHTLANFVVTIMMTLLVSASFCKLQWPEASGALLRKVHCTAQLAHGT